jgi:hypothetical protein
LIGAHDGFKSRLVKGVQDASLMTDLAAHGKQVQINGKFHYVNDDFVRDSIPLRHAVRSLRLLHCPVGYQGRPFGGHCQLTDEEFWHKAEFFSVMRTVGTVHTAFI